MNDFHIFGDSFGENPLHSDSPEFCWFNNLKLKVDGTVFNYCLGCTGPIDMIAMDKKGDIVLIDVKTIHPNNDNDKSPNCKKTRTKKQIKLGVKLLGFNPDDRQLHFIEHKDE